MTAAEFQLLLDTPAQCPQCSRWFDAYELRDDQTCLPCRLADPCLTGSDRATLETVHMLGGESNGFETEADFLAFVVQRDEDSKRMRAFVDSLPNDKAPGLSTFEDHVREWPITCEFFGQPVSPFVKETAHAA